MSSKSKLIHNALNNYKNAPLASWILGLTTGILIAAVLAIDLVAPFVSLLTFPLLVLPIIFSGTVQHAFFKTQGNLTVRNSIKSFGIYFTPMFRSTFRFFSSLLKAVITFLALEMIISFVTSTVFQFTSTGLVDSINAFYELVNSNETTFTMDEVNNILMMNDAVLLKYLIIVLIPSISLASIILIYNASRNSLVIYYQMSHHQMNPRFSRYVYFNVLRGHRMKMMGDYLALNWPMYLLLVLGFSGGAVIGYFWQQNIFTMMAVGNILSALLLAFYLPFYFGNQEALYDEYASAFEISTKGVTAMMLESIQRNIDLSQEEKQRLEESLSFKKDEDEENNKKDSEES